MLAALLETQPRDKVTLLLGFYDWQKEALLGACALPTPFFSRKTLFQQRPGTPKSHCGGGARCDGAAEVTAAAAARQAGGVEAEEGTTPVEVNNEQSAVERCGLYQRGGQLFMTTRILVVDLLSGRSAPFAPARFPMTRVKWGLPAPG